MSESNLPPSTPEWVVDVIGSMAVIGLAAMVAAMIFVHGGTPEPEPTPPPSEPTITTFPTLPGTPMPSEGQPAQPGDAVRDGNLEFVVHEHECGREAIGNEFYEAHAQGIFCLVELTVRNVGDDPDTFDGSAQQGFDAQGRRYAPDPDGGQAANWETTINEQINPGNSVRGYIVFDVAEGTTLTKVELHDSLASSGATVDLS